MIEVKNLVKYYGNRKVLHGLSFTIEKGKICGFLGPNGSGKTTTMDILAGLLGPSSGSAHICGLDILTQTKQAQALIGYLPDNPPLYKEMYVHEFISYVARLHQVKPSEIKKYTQDVMDECSVSQVKDRIIGHLSKGYRQRVALCAALVHKPQVLILDEPTEGLDPNQILHIRNLIKTLSRERTVILSSHILSEVQATCDDALIIRNGHIASRVPLDHTEQDHTSYIYSFADQIDAALSWFQQQNFTDSVKILNKPDPTLLIQFKKDFLLPENRKETLSKVTSELVQKNLPLIGIEEKKEGLEEIFFEIMKSQPNLI